MLYDCVVFALMRDHVHRFLNNGPDMVLRESEEVSRALKIPPSMPLLEWETIESSAASLAASFGFPGANIP